jgi:catalase
MGFRSFPADDGRKKRRLRPASFADHYSQARQFWISQQPIEQQHIVEAFVFELSKVERPDIRARMVANLRNVDEGLAELVADGLGLGDVPDRTEPAQRPNTGLAPSPALSIVANGPDTFEGRKVGVLVTEGADASTVEQLRAAVEAEGAVLEVVAPKVGGVTLSDGSSLPAKQKLGGGPSVLYDAVALVLSDEGASVLATNPDARDFVADAYAHSKFIAFVAGAGALLDGAGVGDRVDDGFVPLDEVGADEFIARCRELRFWDRGLLVSVP